MLRRLFNIQPEERPPAFVLTLYSFLMTATYVFTTNATSSLFLARVDNSDTYYPLLNPASAVITALLVSVFGRLSKRVPLNALAVWTSVLYAAAFITLELALQVRVVLWQAFVLAGLYVLSLTQFTIAGFQFYLIAGTIFDTRQSKRILGLVGIGGALAGITSGLALTPFTELMSALLNSERLGTESVIVLAAGLILLMALVIRQTRRYMVIDRDAEANQPAPQTQAAPPQTRSALADPYLITMMVIVGAFIIAATTIDYQFQVVGNDFFLAQTGNEDAAEQAFTQYKGTYTAVVGSFQLVMRLFVVSPVLVNFGLLTGLLLLPVTIIGAVGTFLISPRLWAATLMKGTDQTVRFTINETATELAWVPIPAAQRLRAKPFISGTYIALMQGVTGISIFALKAFDLEPLRLLSVIVLGVCVVWIPAAVALRRGYLRKLMESIQKRDFAFEDLNIDTADSAIVQTVERRLREGSEIEQLFLLGMMQDVRMTPWTRVLREIFQQSASVPVRAQIITLAARDPEILPDEELMRLIETSSELSDEAMMVAGARGLTGVVPLLRGRLSSSDDEQRAAAAGALLAIGEDTNAAVRTLRMMLEMGDEATNRAALYTVRRLDALEAAEVVLPETLRGLLRKSPSLRLVVLDVIRHTGVALIPEIIGLLDSRTTEAAAREVLCSYPPAQVRESLLAAYTDAHTPAELRAGISRTLADYPHPEVLAAMVASLESPNRVVYNEAVNTLLTFARGGGLNADVLAQLEGEALRLARAMYRVEGALDRVSTQDEPLLVELLQADYDDMTPTLLKLAVMDKPDTDIESVISRLQERDERILGNVLEILDNVLSGEERAVIMPLFEAHTAAELAAIGQKHFPDMAKTLENELIFYINHGDDWQCAIALNYLMRHPRLNIQLGSGGLKMRDGTRQLLAQPGAAGDAATVVRQGERQEDVMFSILEKTVLLKNSMLFQNISARDLYHIAQITEDVKLGAGETLFEQGDPGSTMYIIARGRVRVHQGDVNVALLEEGGAIGEIALLDQKPRTASATALTDAYLLSIEADAFFRTMTAHVDINRSIMRLLAERVRSLLEMETARAHAADAIDQS